MLSNALLHISFSAGRKGSTGERIQGFRFAPDPASSRSNAGRRRGVSHQSRAQQFSRITSPARDAFGQFGFAEVSPRYRPGRCVAGLRCPFSCVGLVPVPYKIFKVAGLGLIDIDPHWSMQVKRRFVYWLLRMAERHSSTAFVFENNADATRIGIDCGRRSKCLNLMGAGVNPWVFVEHPYPSLPPLKLAMVSRMVWSKGIDLAVEAVAELVAKGMPVELDLYGAPDVHNRRYFSTAVLEDWSRRAGIKWRGPVRDVPAVWRRGHKRRRWPTTRIVALPLRSKSGRQLGSRGQGPAHGGELRQLPELLQLKR